MKNLWCSLPTLIVSIVCATVPISLMAQQHYSTPEEAAEAMVTAVKRNDLAAMQIVLGADWRKFIPTQDREDIDAFLAAWDTSHRIEMIAPGEATIAVGEQRWTLPIPIAHGAKGWYFDVRAGADEMTTRRIGRNELAAMQAALAYFDAQREYASIDRDGDEVLQYAQKFASSPDKHDGLYWPVAEGKPQSPLGPLFADTRKKIGEGYHGYRYKILNAQGPAAPGGAYSYLIGKRMVSGFALIAWPVSYGESGIMSFMISHDGQLYEKDLGAKSASIAEGMTQFNPGDGWQKVASDQIADTPQP